MVRPHHRGPRRLLLVALVAAGAACGATPNRSVSPAAGAGVPRPGRIEASPTGASPTGAGTAPAGTVIATVAGQPILATELIEAWLQRESPEVRRLLEDLALARLVVAEARRLGIVLPPELVDEAYREVRAALEDEVARSGSGLTVEQTIERRLGLEPARYLARLREERTIELLTERCARAWVLASERVDARVIVVSEREKADELQRRLAAREDFGALAEELGGELGADGARCPGGRIPPVVRSDSALSRLAFSTPLGSVGGPLFEQGQYLFLLAESRPAPLEGDWSVVGAEVERSLAERPLESPEFWQWKSGLLERYEVDMSPLLELTGSARTAER